MLLFDSDEHMSLAFVGLNASLFVLRPLCLPAALMCEIIACILKLPARDLFGQTGKMFLLRENIAEIGHFYFYQMKLILLAELKRYNYYVAAMNILENFRAM